MPDPLPQRVLVVRLGAIGDVTNALVFATACKAAYPNVHLAWVVHPLALPLVQGHPAIDRVHVWTRGGGLSEFLRLRRELRAEHYDLAIDLQRIQKSALLARASGAPRVLGYDRRRTKEASWLWTNERIPAGHARTHMLDQYVEFAVHLGLDPAAAQRVLPLDVEAESWADAFVQHLGGQPFIVHVGATKTPNRWEPERYGHLIRRLRDAGIGPICLTGGPGDREDADRAMGILAGGHGDVPSDFRDLVGSTSLPQLIALFRRASGFVGCDTGPMHLAAAVGARVVALFGPADPLRTGPYGPEHVVLRRPGAGTDRDVALPDAQIDDLSVDDVARAIRECSGRPPGIPSESRF